MYFFKQTRGNLESVMWLTLKTWGNLWKSWSRFSNIPSLSCKEMHLTDKMSHLTGKEPHRTGEEVGFTDSDWWLLSHFMHLRSSEWDLFAEEWHQISKTWSCIWKELYRFSKSWSLIWKKMHLLWKEWHLLWHCLVSNCDFYMGKVEFRQNDNAEMGKGIG